MVLYLNGNILYCIKEPMLRDNFFGTWMTVLDVSNEIREMQFRFLDVQGVVRRR